MFAVLLGSGVSRSAGVPTGWEITLGLARDLAAMLGERPGDDVAAWYRSRHGAEPEYSALIGQLARAPGERRNFLEPFFEPTADERERGLKRPTVAHRVVARLMASGAVRVCITTNFDRLLEQALAEVGVEPVVVAAEDDALTMAPLVHQRHLIIKVHGDYKDPRIMNTAEELSAYPPAMTELLHRVLRDFGLVVCGWSADWDPALRAAFDRAGKGRYSTFWCTLGAPTPAAAALVDRRGAVSVPIEGADGFFRDLEDKKVSLDELRTPPPDTAEVAATSVKRFLSEDRFRIRLGDFLRKEAVRIAASIETEIFDRRRVSSLQPRATVATIDERCEIARAMFFTAGRHARGDAQADLILDAVRLMPPREQIFGVSMFDWVRQLRLYPVSCVVLSAAFGALSSGNWTTLRRLLSADLEGIGGATLSVCQDLLPMFTLREDAAKLLADQPCKLPASKHYQRVLEPLATDVVRDPQDLLYRLEIWATLTAISRGLVPIPPGLFLLSGGVIGTTQPRAFLEEATQAADAWRPLAAGWFGGTPAGFAAVRMQFEQWLNQPGFRPLAF